MAEQQKTPGDRKSPVEEKPPVAAGKLAGWLRAYRWPLIAGATALLGLSIGLVWYLNPGGRAEPALLLARALECLEARDNPDALSEARRIASELDALKYRDPKFTGAVPYILGMIEFRRAQHQTDRDRLQSYRSAVRRLDQARDGIDTAHRLEADFALGISRAALGDALGARRTLSAVVDTFRPDSAANPPQQFFEAAAALQESSLDQRTPAPLREAIGLNDVVLKKANITAAERDWTYLRRAQLLIAIHDAPAAAEALAQVSPEAAATREAILIRAQIDIAEGAANKERFSKARAALEPLAGEGGLDNLHPRQALFLLGACCEAELDYENALRKYADVVRRYPDSQEGLAAYVRRAELLRKAQRWEEALDAYVKALEKVRPTAFANRWVRLDELRSVTLAAWEDLRRTEAFEFAVELARHMRNLFPPKEAWRALEKVATANERWASHLEAEIAGRPYQVREARRAERLERWRTSGKAYAELADALHDAPKYADMLWTSSEHFRRGHDFQNALVQMTRFINAQPKQRLPVAYVRRGEILMDLGRYDEALDHFERVLSEFSTDIASFQAMYLIGACEVERNKADRAMQAWQRVLHDPHLDPSANEWQAALFALGRLRFQCALTVKPDSGTGPVSTPVDARPRPPAAYEHLDDAIRRLEEFVARYPSRQEVPEARFLLAKALRERAALPRHKLALAETDNARKELKTEIHRLLLEAQNELDTLIEALQAKETAGMLDPLGQRMLRDSYFERAHNLYSLEQYDRAIECYTNAANRYVDDPNVFLAYIQMANCYDRLNKPIDARGAAVQAMLIHKNMPEKAFTPDKTVLTRDEWKTWLDWAGSLRQSSRRSEGGSTPRSTAATVRTISNGVKLSLSVPETR